MVVYLVSEYCCRVQSFLVYLPVGTALKYSKCGVQSWGRVLHWSTGFAKRSALECTLHADVTLASFAAKYTIGASGGALNLIYDIA